MKTQAATQVAQTRIAERAVPAVLALLLGTFLITGIGFAHSETIHNAAHDARHAFGFPCH